MTDLFNRPLYVKPLGTEIWPLLLCSSSHLATWSCLRRLTETSFTAVRLINYITSVFQSWRVELLYLFVLAVGPLKMKQCQWYVLGQLADCAIHTGKACLLFYWYKIIFGLYRVPVTQNNQWSNSSFTWPGCVSQTEKSGLTQNGSVCFRFT